MIGAVESMSEQKFSMNLAIVVVGARKTDSPPTQGKQCWVLGAIGSLMPSCLSHGMAPCLMSCFGA
jgi:hypothetical protein